MTTSYYNEFNPESAAMLRQMMADGIIPKGEVDERSITEIKPSELIGYTQCHFFAGIGGWSIALRLAGHENTEGIWTGSCPCQPFSAAGRQKGKSDHRHLWPVWFELIKAVQPSTIFGEQVASAIGHGWLDEVAEDLESVRFTHQRENLYRMQDPETYDRVSEILWQIKRGRSASVQDLPAGIREEVAQFIGRIQGGATPETPRNGQDLSTEIPPEKQGSLFGFGDTASMQQKGNTVRLGKPHRKNSKQNKYGILRGQRVPIEQDHLCGSGVQHTVDRQDKPEYGLCLQQHQDSCLLGQCCNGGLGRGQFQADHEKMDGEINAEQKPCATGTTGSQSETGFTHGWLDDVYQGLEPEGYAVGSAVLPACSVGAPHKRDRLWFVADRDINRWSEGRRSEPPARWNGPVGNSRDVQIIVANASGQRLEDGRVVEMGKPGSLEQSERCCGHDHVGDASGTRSASGLSTPPCRCKGKPEIIINGSGRCAWYGEWIDCPDGKARLIKPGIPLLAHGVQHRRPILHAIGNAIVPQVAAKFIQASM